MSYWQAWRRVHRGEWPSYVFAERGWRYLEPQLVEQFRREREEATA